MLSICITTKNRSKVQIRKDKALYLFPQCIDSIAESFSLRDKFEVVIADWESDDWPIKNWITDRLPNVPIHLLTIESDKGFSRGKGRNIAAQHALGDKLLFLDADMIVNHNVINKGIRLTRNGQAFYPTIKYEVNEQGKQIIHEGGGNLFISKDDFDKTGGWPEYWSYGFEDVDFVTKVKSVTSILTDVNSSMLHQWHPDTVKKLYDSKEEENVKEINNRKEHFKKKEIEPIVKLDSITKQFLNDSNTTHSKLNIAKGEAW